MTKKLFILLLLSSSLFCSSVFTLDKIKNLKFHFTNNTHFIEKPEEQSIRDLIKNKLQKAGFTFGEVDPINFVVKVKSVEIDEVHVISIFFGLAEDVTTKRIGQIETYAFTYMTDTLIESEDPYEDTIEAIDFLTCQFLTAYRDDNEQKLK